MKRERKGPPADGIRREELLRVCTRLLVLGAVNWSGQWYRQAGRLSLDQISAQATRLFLR